MTTPDIPLVDDIAATLRGRLAMGSRCGNLELLACGYTAEQIAEAADKAREIVRKERRT